MKNIILFSLFLLLSCSSEVKTGPTIRDVEIHERPKNEEQFIPVPIDETLSAAADVPQQAIQKAIDFRSASSLEESGSINGIYIYSKTYKAFASKPDQLAARVAMLGFGEVYLSAGTSEMQHASETLRKLLSAFYSYGIKTYALRISDINILVDRGIIDHDVALVEEYNKKVRQEERFAGISADLEPHIAKNNANHPAGLEYYWDSDKNYGKGKDNDKLLELTLNRLTYARNIMAHSLQLNEAIFYNYQINYDSGLLSFGSTSQFLGPCDWVIVMAYLQSKYSIIEKSLPCLKDSKKDASVSICLKTAMNEHESSSLQPLGWENLIGVIKYVSHEASTYNSYRGIDIFTYEGLEDMWL